MGGIAPIGHQAPLFDGLPELVSINRRPDDLLRRPPGLERISAVSRYLQEVDLIPEAADYLIRCNIAAYSAILEQTRRGIFGHSGMPCEIESGSFFLLR